MVAHFLKPFVDNNATEPKVQADLEEICKVMGNYSKECAQYVREYFPMMFELLKQGVVSGVHVCDYASVTMYQNGCVLCLLYPLNYTCMEFCSVLS